MGLYATSIATGIVQVAGIFFLRETYSPRILKVRAKKLRIATGDSSYQTVEEREGKTLLQLMQVSLVRPFRLLFTQLIIQALALYMAYIYGLYYLLMSTFPDLWTDVYNESTGIGGVKLHLSWVRVYARHIYLCFFERSYLSTSQSSQFGTYRKT